MKSWWADSQEKKYFLKADIVQKSQCLNGNDKKHFSYLSPEIFKRISELKSYLGAHQHTRLRIKEKSIDALKKLLGDISHCIAGQ